MNVSLEKIKDFTPQSIKTQSGKQNNRLMFEQHLSPYQGSKENHGLLNTVFFYDNNRQPLSEEP